MVTHAWHLLGDEHSNLLRSSTSSGQWRPFASATSLMPQVVFTLYQIVKQGAAESVPDRACVYTRIAAFEAVSAPEQYCSAPLLKVEHSVLDRFLKQSKSSLNTFIGAEIATEIRIGK